MFQCQLKSGCEMATYWKCLLNVPFYETKSCGVVLSFHINIRRNEEFCSLKYSFFSFKKRHVFLSWAKLTNLGRAGGESFHRTFPFLMTMIEQNSCCLFCIWWKSETSRKKTPKRFYNLVRGAPFRCMRKAKKRNLFKIAVGTRLKDFTFQVKYKKYVKILK